MKQSFTVRIYYLFFGFKKKLLIGLGHLRGISFISRLEFLTRIDRTKKVLEIGPFTIPSVEGPLVDYFDVLTREELLERAIRINYPHDQCPFIKYVSPTGDLSVVTETYDYVVSSHCIEHQPDLIQHLFDVEKILNSEGRYMLVIPDKRYCMDAYLPESVLQDILQAYEEKRKVHTLRSVIEHRALRTHNKAWLHWTGKHGKRTDILPLIKDAIHEYKEASGGYIDVHAWQFTPVSFTKIISELHQLGLSPFLVEEVYSTKPGDFEFYVVLKRG